MLILKIKCPMINQNLLDKECYEALTKEYGQDLIYVLHVPNNHVLMFKGEKSTEFHERLKANLVKNDRVQAIADLKHIDDTMIIN